MEPSKIVFSGKSYNILNVGDIKARELRNAQHILNLKSCTKYLENVEALIVQLERERELSKKWKEYIGCLPYPKPYIPPDIRFFIEKIKRDEFISNQQTLSWLLSVDERSILSQNIFREDLTYSALQHERAKFSAVYDKDIDGYLKVLQRIDDFLDVSSECGKEKLEDIKVLQNTLRQEISESLNRFTYRILSSEEANMNSLDAITAEYTFEGDHFQMHIWSLKNVAIRLDRLKTRRLNANLHGINAILSIPINIMKEKFTIRAVHMNFVHISTSERVFLEEVVEPPEIASFEFKNLPECLEGEWQKQLEIQNEIQSKMIHARDAYLAELKQLEEEKAKAKRKVTQDQDEVKRKKVKKAKESSPDIGFITDDMIPDVTEVFYEEERKQFQSYFNSLYNPSLKNYSSDEINLKMYAILGGVYQLYQVEKPNHFEFKSFNITNHYNESKLIVNTDFTIPYIPDKRSSHRKSSVFIREPRQTFFSKIELPIVEIDCPWFILVIELPEYLCYWGEPIVCQYETITKFEAKTVVPTATKIVSHASKKWLKLNKQIHDTIEKKEISSEPLDTYLPFLTPRKEDLTESLLQIENPSTENFLNTAISKIHLAQEDDLAYRPFDSEGIINIHDFPLTSALTIAELRHMERHVMPRMLSSFKFNKDIEDEAQLKDLKKMKSQSKSILGILKRRPSLKVAEKNEFTFTLGNMQNFPERLIPIFTPEEPVRFLQLQNDIQDPKAVNREIKSFAQLVALINFIKWWQKTKVRQLIDLPDFKPKISIPNARIRKPKKPKKKPIMYDLSESSQKSRFKLRVGKSAHKMRVSLKTTEDDTSDIRPSILSAVSLDSSILTQKEEPEVDYIKYTYTRWTTKNIFKSEYNKEKRTITIQTNKLGYFGLAFKLYRHFPFKFWKFEPNPNDPENEVIFTLETQCVRCIFNITEKGITCVVTDIIDINVYVRNVKKYLLIDEPLDNMKKLKQIFTEKNINIFADKDARLYIENGMFSEKHLPAEQHTYNCMAINCNQIKFCHCIWNRLAGKRDLILKFMQYQDTEDNMTEARLTPEQAYFIETTESCSENLKIIKLKFSLTWRNLGFYSDLQGLVNSMYPATSELKCKNPMLLHFVQNLLFEIRPLSFS